MKALSIKAPWPKKNLYQVCLDSALPGVVLKKKMEMEMGKVNNNDANNRHILVRKITWAFGSGDLKKE